MKLFISWSGERSRQLAVALREWIPFILGYTEPWLSESDIQPGERWSVEVAKGLDDCNFGIICVTPENVNSPWILFEAGALAKSVHYGRVIPILLGIDIKDLSGPLAQFQAKKADEAGIKKLVLSLNEASSQSENSGKIEQHFSMIWKNLEDKISFIPKGISPRKPDRPQDEILEELVAGVRSMEMGLRVATSEAFQWHRRRRLRFGAIKMTDMIPAVADNPRDPIQLLILAGVFREEVPWLYEIAREAYYALRSENAAEGRKAVRRLRKALELVREEPYIGDLGIDRLLKQTMRFTDVEQTDIFENTEDDGTPLARHSRPDAEDTR
jgi:hypothetical protein